MTRRNLVVWVLVLINVALLAFIVTSSMRPAQVVVSPALISQPFGILTDLESLSAADRRAVRQAIIQRLPEMREAAAATRSAIDQMAGAFQAETFDADTARAAAEALGQARAAQWRIGSDIVIDIVDDLPDEARHELMRRRAELRENAGRPAMGEPFGGAFPGND